MLFARIVVVVVGEVMHACLCLLTVVAMEVLIKYCINSFPKLTNSFHRKLINFLQNYSKVKFNWLSG